MSKVDVRAIAEGQMGWSAEDIDPQVLFLKEFASLVLEEAAKSIEFRIAASPGDKSLNFEAEMCADTVRSLKPVQP